MDGVTVSVLGALVALAVAIVLILKKVQPTYAMIFGAVIGGLVGGAGLTGTVSFIISGTQGIVSAIIRIVTAGILAGALIESGAAERIAESIINKMGAKRSLIAITLAPISGMLMGAATASATAGTTLASQIFGPTVVASGVTPLAAAAMTHASCFVFDGLPHGSFFHVSAGGVNMEISERLKLLGYEAINGLAMMAVSTLVFGVLKLAG